MSLAPSFLETLLGSANAILVANEHSMTVVTNDFVGLHATVRECGTQRVSRECRRAKNLDFPTCLRCGRGSFWDPADPSLVEPEVAPTVCRLEVDRWGQTRAALRLSQAPDRGAHVRPDSYLKAVAVSTGALHHSPR